MRGVWLVVCLWGIGAEFLRAQLPSEALLVVNASSPEAVAVAEEYAALRGFPQERILSLSPPPRFFRRPEGTPRWDASEAEVREVLLDPLLGKLEELGDAFPTALVFSPDWPTRVRLEGGAPSVSLTGFCGFRGRMPEAEALRGGRAWAPWFIAPEDLARPGARLRRYPAPGLPVDAPHPAMMLGVFQEPLDPGTLAMALRRSVAADFRKPQGSVLFLTNRDVRTHARLPQFAPAAERLRRKGIPVLLAPEEADLPGQILGVMAGAASVDTGRFQGRLVPGAFAEHLTSWGATFDNPSQTKITEWLAAGAAGSAGTVTEPYAIWTKFPHAALFERRLLGETLLEALAQSLASPYQQLFLGDPLSRPWAESLPGLRLEAFPRGDRLHVEAGGFPPGSATDLHLFLNGYRVAGPGPEWNLPLPAGPALLQLHARHNWAPPAIGYVRLRWEPSPPLEP